MSTNRVRCFRCRGQKKYIGMGGIERDCEVCDATGTVKKISLKPAAPVAEVEHVEPVAAAEVIEVIEVIETIASIEPNSVVDVQSEVQIQAITETHAPTVKTGPIFAGYDDELMRAVLAEPTMTTENWRLKYASTSITTDVRQRHSIREMYAASQPIADRKVDLSASQDAAVNDDVDYKKFVANEKKMAAKAAVAKEKSPPSAKKENKKTGVGGV